MKAPSRMPSLRPWIALVLGLAASQPSAPGPRVTIDSGVVEGATFGHATGAAAFKGIPYAAPPMADLRWRPPRPVDRWSGVRAAQELGPACPQQADRVQNFWKVVVEALGGDPGVVQPIGRTSEDCLTLNVWTSNLGGKTTHPVMVWIHGAGFVANRGGEEPAVLAAEGAVVVTINYRLGALGFLAHPALSKESSHGSSGNYGLLDQIEALKWVRRNIAAFGGDPNRVTVFGPSAGGTAVLHLLASPLASGLFHRAIAQSAGLAGARTLSAAEAAGADVATRWGAAAGDPLRTLRETSVDALLSTPPRQGYGPVRDGWVIEQSDTARQDQERLQALPLIVGATTHESANQTLMSPQSVPKDREAYRALVGQAGPPWGNRLLAVYPAEDDAGVRAAAIRFLTDRDFVCASRYVAAKRGGPSWLYLVSAVPAPTPAGERLGPFHGADQRFMFNLEYGIPLGARGRRVGEALRRYWVRFAEAGDPNRDGLPEWPRYAATKPSHLEFGDTIGPVSGLGRDGCDVFDELWDARFKQQAARSAAVPGHRHVE